MIDLDQIRQFFPEALQKNPLQYEYMLKEYFHYKTLKAFHRNLVFDQAERKKVRLFPEYIRQKI